MQSERRGAMGRGGDRKGVEMRGEEGRGVKRKEGEGKGRKGKRTPERSPSFKFATTPLVTRV